MTDLFSLALDKVDNGVLIIDGRQNIVFWNKCLEKITHRSAGACLYRDIKNVAGIFRTGFYQSALDAVLCHNQSRFFSSKLHKAFIVPECSEYVEVRQNMKIEPITVNGQAYAFIQIEDITNEINREHKLTSLLSELQKGYEQIKESERLSKTLAETDSLTGLTNRYYITQKLNDLFMSKEELIDFSLFFLDLDGFKDINDTYGHDTGDIVLKKTGEILQQDVGEKDVVSRLGGDEFVLLVKSADRQELSTFANKLMDDIAKLIIIDEHSIHITASIGILVITSDVSSVSEIIKKADLAMYEAKKHGKNQFVFYK